MTLRESIALLWADRDRVDTAIISAAGLAWLGMYLWSIA